MYTRNSKHRHSPHPSIGTFVCVYVRGAVDGAEPASMGCVVPQSATHAHTQHVSPSQQSKIQLHPRMLQKHSWIYTCSFWIFWREWEQGMVKEDDETSKGGGVLAPGVARRGNGRSEEGHLNTRIEYVYFNGPQTTARTALYFSLAADSHDPQPSTTLHLAPPAPAAVTSTCGRRCTSTQLR